MIRSAAALALALLVSGAVRAGEPVAIDYSAVAPIQGSTPVPPPDKAGKGYPATPAGASTGKVIFSDSSSEVSAAFCGIEGHKDAADLDAGLLDFNVADPARAAGGSAETPKDQGRNQYDYHSSVVLGVTVGYRF